MNSYIQLKIMDKCLKTSVGLYIIYYNMYYIAAPSLRRTYAQYSNGRPLLVACRIIYICNIIYIIMLYMKYVVFIL